MAIDALLKLEGIDGESEDAEHPRAIEIQSWEWGATQSGVHLGTSGGLMSNVAGGVQAVGKMMGGNQRSSSSTGNSAQRGKVGVSAITITKFSDKSSTTLLTHLFNNKPIPKGSLINRKDMGGVVSPTTKSLPYLILDLRQVVVSGYKIINSEDELLARETITLNFWEITVRYVQQLESGIKGRESSVTWDVAGALGRDEEEDDRQRSRR